MSTTISIKRNNDSALSLTVKKDGTAENITGWTIKFSVKENRNDIDADAIIFKTVTSHTNPTSGLSAIPIDADDTKDKEIGDYYYDILFIDDLGKRQSTATGTFRIVQEITDGE